MNYTIREAVGDDAESYNRFFRKIVDEPYNNITRHPGEYIGTDEETRQRLIEAQTNDNQIIFVAVDDNNQVIGEISARGRARQSMVHCVGIGISVAATYRGQGIGTALMQQVLAWAEHNPVVLRLELEVFSDNLRAINIYLKLGFVIEGLRRNAYRKHYEFKHAYMMAILYD